jgi:peptidylprolyl isomerase
MTTSLSLSNPSLSLIHLSLSLSVYACIHPTVGNKGMGKCGKPLHYLNTPFHRILPGFICQSGDFVMLNGSGGESIFNKKFKDEKEGLKIKLDKRGLLAMCNTGKNSNTSQFFFTFADCSKLTGKHVVFGEIVDGWEVLDRIESVGGNKDNDGKPTTTVNIVECGLLA